MKALIPKFLFVLYLIQTADERLIIKNVSPNSPLFTEEALSSSHTTDVIDHSFHSRFVFSPVSFRL